MSDELIHDREAIRNSDDPDVTRIVRRVGAALNSGRDAAVVAVVLDETETLRARVDQLTDECLRLRADPDTMIDHLAIDGALTEETRTVGGWSVDDPASIERRFVTQWDAS